MIMAIIIILFITLENGTLSMQNAPGVQQKKKKKAQRILPGIYNVLNLLAHNSIVFALLSFPFIILFSLPFVFIHLCFSFLFFPPLFKHTNKHTKHNETKTRQKVYFQFSTADFFRFFFSWPKRLLLWRRRRRRLLLLLLLLLATM